MSQIQNVIPTQKFELIRDRIGEILADEINNQYLLSYNYNIDAEVWVERIVPFDNTELPAINVQFVGGPYGDTTIKDTQGEYTYHIDVWTNSPSSNDGSGDVLARKKLHRLMGIVRAILQSPFYKTLGYAAPFSCSRKVKDIAVNLLSPGQDALNSVMGRLSFVVRIPETHELVTPVLIYEYITQVKLYLTNKGYLYGATTVPAPAIDATIITAQSQLIVG